LKASESTIQQLRAQGVEIFDNSMISTFLSCPRKYFYRHRLGLVRKDINVRQSYGLNFGAAIHQALETWELTSRDDDAALRAFREAFEGLEEPEATSPKTGKPLKATYTMLYGSVLLDAYFDKYRKDERKVLEVEVPLAEEVADGIYICGRIDKIMERSDRELVFADYKTTKYVNKFIHVPNPQFQTYSWLVERLSNRRPKGELDILGVSKSAPPDEMLTRVPIEYTDWQMAEWQTSLIRHIEAIKRGVEAEAALAEDEQFRAWPQAWNCMNFNRECPYLALCSLASLAAHEPIMQSLYEVDFWDPFGVIDG